MNYNPAPPETAGWVGIVADSEILNPNATWPHACHVWPSSSPWRFGSKVLIRAGVVADYAELARLGHVSRARITQIGNLLNLAPDIQESILFLPAVKCGKDSITERDLRPIVATADWRTQRRMWRYLAESLETE